MKFLPFLSPIFKTIRPRPQDTCRLVPGMQHVFAMKQYLPEGRQARKQITVYPRTMVKTNGTEVKTTSVPLAF